MGKTSGAAVHVAPFSFRSTPKETAPIQSIGAFSFELEMAANENVPQQTSGVKHERKA
jgi:hypothetical protein